MENATAGDDRVTQTETATEQVLDVRSVGARYQFTTPGRYYSP